MEKEKDKKSFYEKWCFWLILIVLIVLILIVRFNEETSETSSKNNDTNIANYISEQKQNYENNIKLKGNPYETTNQYDGIYSFSLESDNGSGHIFTAIGVITFNNGNCKVKYEYDTELINGTTKEYEGFCGLNKEDNSSFYFSLNNDDSYAIITYKCEPNEKNLSCELKSTYDLAGCTNTKLDLIYSDNQNLNDLDLILSDTIKEENEKKIAEEEAKKEQEEADFKASCQTYTFEQMARNPDNFKGTNVKVTGEVIQALYSNGSVDLRVNITKEGIYSTYYTDTIYVVYYPEAGEDKILEDDIITIYGTSQGEYTYTSAIGTQVTLPLIQAKYIELNK